jgi:hypothetical protein
MARRMCRPSSRIGGTVSGVPRTPRSGGGNRTRVWDSASTFSKGSYDITGGGWPEKGRVDEALRELVANWRRLTPSVRHAIMALVPSWKCSPNSAFRWPEEVRARTERDQAAGFSSIQHCRAAEAHWTAADGSDTDALSRSFDAPLGPHLIPLGSDRTLPGAARTGLLAAGSLGLCQQFFRFVQEAWNPGVFCPARILHPLP